LSEQASRRTGKFEVSTELLMSILHLPPGTDIVAINSGKVWPPNGPLETIKITVSHPDLLPVPWDADDPIIKPQWKKQEEIVFAGWGQTEIR
jgi:hypothetical protein